VLAKTKPEIEKALEIVRSVIEGRLGLRLSPEKTKIVTFADGFDFLGFHFQRDHLTMRAKSVEKFQEKIKSIRSVKHIFLLCVPMLKLQRHQQRRKNVSATRTHPARAGNVAAH